MVFCIYCIQFYVEKKLKEEKDKPTFKLDLKTKAKKIIIIVFYANFS